MKSVIVAGPQCVLVQLLDVPVFRVHIQATMSEAESAGPAVVVHKVGVAVDVVAVIASSAAGSRFAARPFAAATAARHCWQP